MSNLPPNVTERDLEIWASVYDPQQDYEDEINAEDEEDEVEEFLAWLL